MVQGYPIESMAGVGFPNSTFNGNANQLSGNPASLYDSKNLSIGLSYQFDSKIEQAWLVGIGHKRYQNNFPQSVGIVFPLKNVRVALGMYQRYNSIMDFGEVDPTIIEDPEGTGETYSVRDTSTIMCYAGSISYSLQHIFKNNDKLHFGIQYNFNQFSARENIYHLHNKFADNSSSWTIGVRYDLPQKMKVGLFFERGPAFRTNGVIKSDGIFIKGDIDPSQIGNNENIKTSLNTHWFIDTKLPDRLHLGALFSPSPKITITLDISRIFWHQLNDDAKDYIDISGVLRFEPREFVTFSCGFLSTDLKFSDELDKLFGMNGKLSGLFILGGVTLHLYHFDIGFAYTKTTGNSGEWRKQSIKNFSLNYHI